MNYPISSNRFTIDKDKKIFIIEASDLTSVSNQLRTIPKKISIKSERTGNIANFYLETFKENGSECTEIIFKPDVESIFIYPKLKDWTLVVLND